MNARIIGVGVATKELPRSQNDKTRVPTLVIVFYYRSGDKSKDDTFEGESERWVNEEKSDDLAKELNIVRDFTGKNVDLSEEGLVELISLKQSDWDKVPIEINTSNGKTYMSIIRVASDFEQKKSMIMDAVKNMNLPKKAGTQSSSGTSASSRPRPSQS